VEFKRPYYQCKGEKVENFNGDIYRDLKVIAVFQAERGREQSE
jgi:hypothetical protein